MNRWVCFLLVVLIAGLGQGAGAALLAGDEAVLGGPEQKVGQVMDGHALLTGLTEVFQELLVEGGGMGAAEKRVNDLMVNALATRDAGKIDGLFFNRFRRLILMFKVTMIPVVGENQVWEPVIRRQLQDFVEGTLGVDWTLDIGNRNCIEDLARAMEEECISLWIYLDTLPRREELRKKVSGRMLPPPPPPKPAPQP